MKKIILTAATVVFLSACSHNAKVCGTYQGILPAADAPGIAMTISLNPDNQFKNKMVYIDRKDGTFYETGTYRVNGNILELKGDEDVSYYKIEKGQLRLLDFEKQEIIGALADYYVLKRTASCRQ